MPGVPLAARVLEVITDRGELAQPRYRYGSGCLVAGRTVLTAAHVVVCARSVQVRGPDKELRAARVDPSFVGEERGPGPDLALLEIEDAELDVPAMDLAAVDRDRVDAEPVQRCHAVGYPWFAERPSPHAVRDTVDAYGHMLVLSMLASGLLSLQVSSAPRALPPQQEALGQSQWSGMSGAPVVAAGCLLGVVTEHAPREGPSTITVTPLTALERDDAHPGWGPGVANPAAWWARLEFPEGSARLSRLPRQRKRPEPAYGATVQEIHERTGQLLGRQEELREIAEFATGSGGYRWVVGNAWAGKTALLAEAVAAALPGQVDVVSYFLSRREADADGSRFLAAVVPQLADLLEEDPPLPDLHQFRALWRRAVETAAGADRYLLLVVDGLDEDLHPVGSPSVAALLPASVTGRAHVLVSSRPYPGLPVDVPVGHPLHSISELQLQVELEPFEGAAVLAALAAQEIDQLKRRDDGGLAAAALGVLTAASGPLAVADLAVLTADPAPPTSAHTRRVRRLVTEEAARSLQPVGPAADRRYQFAHGSLLEYAQGDDDLAEYRVHIHEWAEQWKAAGWPTAAAPLGAARTPRYLLDAYPAALHSDPPRLAALVSDVNWVTAAIQTIGVDAVLAELQTAAAVDPAETRMAAMHATLRGQAHHLRGPEAVRDPGFVTRQLCLQAAELGEDMIAADCRARLLACADSDLVPQWTTRRASPALVLDLGGHIGPVSGVAVLPDGRVVSGGADRRVRLWDPAAPQAPVDLGSHDGWVSAVAVLPDGRVVSGGADRRVRLWDLQTLGPCCQIACSAQAFATAISPSGAGLLVIAHSGGVSGWSAYRS